MDYVVENFLDRSATLIGISRKNYIGIVNLRALSKSAAKLFGDGDYYTWDESKSYTLFCPSGNATHPVVFSSTFNVSKDFLADALSEMNLEISAGEEKILVWKNILKNIDIEQLKEKGSFKFDNLALNYEGRHLTINYRKNITINQKETNISIKEVSFLAKDEKSTSLALLEPTFKFNYSLTIDSSLKNQTIYDPAVSPARYHADATGDIEIDNDGKKLIIIVPKWVLPGIVLALEWGESE